MKMFVQYAGLLPRGEHEKPIVSLPTYKPGNPWSRSKALFGQNDYIGECISK